MGEHRTDTDERIEDAIALLEALSSESFSADPFSAASFSGDPISGDPFSMGSSSNGSGPAAGAGVNARPGSSSPSALSGPHLLRRVPRIERLGRLADALRIRYAAETATRTNNPIDSLGAAGYASAKDAVAQLAGVSDPEAGRRIRVGEGTAPGIALSGAAVAPRFPAIADAVAQGVLGIEAADVLIRELDAVSSRVDPVVLHEAEEELVRLAAGHDGGAPLRVDLVRVQVKAFILAIDPDGPRPREQRVRAQRRLTFGEETVDGLIPISGLLVAEVGGTFKRLVDAHVRRVTFAEEGERVPASADDRTPAQRRHDVLADIVGAASRVKDAPELAGAAPAVTVTVTEKALTLGRGAGYLDGHDTPLSLDAVERLIDTRGLQIVTMGESGAVLSLSSTQRCFTASQRRAIGARDGGCIIPGCTTPAGWCEVHHVTPWRAGGETHVDNGVLLCWGHHQRIDSGPWRLSMPHGVPHVRGPGHHDWTPTTKSRARPSPPRTG